MKLPYKWIIFAGVVFLAQPAGADLFHSPKFKSPAGKYEVIVASAGSASIPFTHEAAHVPLGQKAQYVLLFYVAGASDPVSADWYTDADPAPTPDQIIASLLWSPGEAHVVVTHGQSAQAKGINRWLISLKNPSAYGFEGEHLHWVDERRLVADLQTRKVPGGIELVDAGKSHAELIVSPRAGTGYQVVAVDGPRVTVKEYLNHWGEERDKTSWEFFVPACFDLDINTLKKRSVTCPPLGMP